MNKHDSVALVMISHSSEENWRNFVLESVDDERGILII